MKRPVLILMILALCRPIFAQEPAAPAQQPTTQQQQQQADAEARREAERIAAEKAREEARRKESEARLEEFKKLRPPTREERMATHLRLMGDFQKNVRRLEKTSREIVAMQSNDKGVAKKARSLNDTTSDVLKYVLFEANEPPPPPGTFDGFSVKERIRLLGEQSGQLYPALNEWSAAQKKFIVDVGKTTALIRDLQTFSLLVRSFYR